MCIDKKMSRACALVLMCATLATMGLGCGKAPVAGGEDARNTLVVATMSETPSVGPYDHNAVAGSYVNSLVFATLFRMDSELAPEPWLVESFENVDAENWVFKLREDIKFHDGTQLKAADVAASLMFAKESPEISFYTKSVETIDVEGDYTIKIKTPGPSATLLNDLTHHGNAIVPKALIDSKNDFGKNPIGAGPYKFHNWILGDKIVFTAFEEYFAGAPEIKTIEWRTIPEGSSRTISLEAGEVDLVIEVEGMDSQRLEDNAKIKVLRHEATSVSWLILNNEKPPFDNADFRHAVNSAINKENVVTVSLNNIGAALSSQIPNGLLGASQSAADEYDMVRAKSFLEKSGADPVSVKMSIICSNDQKKRAAEVIQADLAQIGIPCQVETMDLATYLSTTADGNFTASIGGYASSDTVSYLLGVYHSKSIGASNKSRISNPEIDALIDKAATTVDEAEREKILSECGAALNEICPQIPLWQDIYIRAFNAELSGIAINSGGDIRFENISWAK